MPSNRLNCAAAVAAVTAFGVNATTTASEIVAAHVLRSGDQRRAGQDSPARPPPSPSQTSMKMDFYINKKKICVPSRVRAFVYLLL